MTQEYQSLTEWAEEEPPILKYLVGLSLIHLDKFYDVPKEQSSYWEKWAGDLPEDGIEELNKQDTLAAIKDVLLWLNQKPSK